MLNHAVDVLWFSWAHVSVSLSWWSCWVCFSIWSHTVTRMWTSLRWPRSSSSSSGEFGSLWDCTSSDWQTSDSDVCVIWAGSSTAAGTGRLSGFKWRKVWLACVKAEHKSNVYFCVRWNRKVPCDVCAVHAVICSESDISALENKHLAKRARRSQEDGWDTTHLTSTDRLFTSQLFQTLLWWFSGTTVTSQSTAPTARTISPNMK